MIQSPRLATFLTVLAVACGAVLRLRAYLVERSLWLDEAQLALNIVRRTREQLLAPLDFHQAAPPGFLWAEKLVVDLAGDGENALRLIPLLASLASLVLVYRLCQGLLRPLETALAVSFVALSGPLVYYASELKQYSTDLFVVVSVVACASYALDRELSRAGLVGCALVGSLGVWLSHPAAFACVGSTAILLAAARIEGRRRQLRDAVVLGIAWGASLLLHYLSFMSSLSKDAYLSSFWQAGFPNLPPRSADDLLWWPRTLVNVFSDPVGFSLPGVATVAAVAGAVRLKASAPWRLGLLLAPIVGALAAAGLHQYPFATSDSTDYLPLSGRIVLFVVPLLMVLCAAGLGSLCGHGDPVVRGAGAAMVALLVGGTASQAVEQARHPPSLNEVRGLVATIGNRGRATDVVVVNEKGLPTISYYIDRFRPAKPFLAKLPIEVLKGKGSHEQHEVLLGGLQARRIWLVYAHHPSWRSEEDQAHAKEILGRRGSLVFEKHAPGASLFLFRLDRPAS